MVAPLKNVDGFRDSNTIYLFRLNIYVFRTTNEYFYLSHVVLSNDALKIAHNPIIVEYPIYLRLIRPPVKIIRFVLFWLLFISSPKISIRARCPSIFKCTTIELTFVTLGHGLKRFGSVCRLGIWLHQSVFGINNIYWIINSTIYSNIQ